MAKKKTTQQQQKPIQPVERKLTVNVISCERSTCHLFTSGVELRVDGDGKVTLTFNPRVEKEKFIENLPYTYAFEQCRELSRGNNVCTYIVSDDGVAITFMNGEVIELSGRDERRVNMLKEDLNLQNVECRLDGSEYRCVVQDRKNAYSKYLNEVREVCKLAIDVMHKFMDILP